LETNLTPRTEAKYNKIDEEFQIMMQHRNGVSSSRASLPAGFPAGMPVSVPVEAGFNDNSSQHESPLQINQLPISPASHLAASASSPRPNSGNG
jgi:MADS-box transcription enhancer factor 2A